MVIWARFFSAWWSDDPPVLKYLIIVYKNFQKSRALWLAWSLVFFCFKPLFILREIQSKTG